MWIAIPKRKVAWVWQWNDESIWFTIHITGVRPKHIMHRLTFFLNSTFVSFFKMLHRPNRRLYSWLLIEENARYCLANGSAAGYQCYVSFRHSQLLKETNKAANWKAEKFFFLLKLYITNILLNLVNFITEHFLR